MSSSSKPGRGFLPVRGSTLLVLAFLVITILPAFAAFALTPQDAQVVTNVQGWNGCAYRVQRGDNLFRIGVRYGVTYQYLAQINGIYNPNYVYAGQTISVPCGPVPYVPDYHYRPSNQQVYPPYECPWCQPYEIPDGCQPDRPYTVQPGDNLFRIAVYNGSTIQWIRTRNELWGKVLRPNVQINIPCPGYAKYPNIQTPTPGGIITQVPIPSITPADRIRMRGGQFRPAARTVQVGTTVTWENTEDESGPAYTIQSAPDLPPELQFSSGPIPPGGTFTHTFVQPGVYQYFSPSFPQTMTGTITVNQ